MKFKTRFVPKIVEFSAVKAGDLLIANDDETARVVLAVEDEKGDSRGAVLAEWGKKTSRVLPNSGLLIHLREVNYPFRVIDSGLYVEPVGHEKGSSLISAHYTNGALAIFENGEIGIRVAPDFGGGAWVWSLSTGKLLDTASTKYWLSQWRLVWRDGDEEITLCQFPAGAT